MSKLVARAGQPSWAALQAIAAEHLAAYRYDPFLHYPAPAATVPHWQQHWHARLTALRADAQVDLYASDGAILATRDSAWDRAHFGFGMATVQILLAAEGDAGHRAIARLLPRLKRGLRRRAVRFASIRVHGDQLPALHALEAAGFRYFDNVIWPVATLTGPAPPLDARLRLATVADRARLVELAQTSAYPRGHLYCDAGFAKAAVDAMYGKWLDTAMSEGVPLAVVEHAGRVQGLFQFSVEPVQQPPLGHRYGHMRLLVLDGAARGLGLGQALFAGAMTLMQQMGASHIDSGYSTKNHVSARMHARAGFHSVHEEVTLHLWLAP